MRSSACAPRFEQRLLAHMGKPVGVLVRTADGLAAVRGPPPLCPHETRGRARGSLTDGRAGPAFARRAVGSECNLIVLDAVDVPVCLRRMLAFLSASIAPERLIVSDGLLPDQRAFLAVTAWAAWSTGPSPLPLLVSRPVHLSSSF